MPVNFIKSRNSFFESRFVQASTAKKTYGGSTARGKSVNVKLLPKAKYTKSFYPQPDKLVEVIPSAESPIGKIVNNVVVKGDSDGEFAEKIEKNNPIVLGFNPLDPSVREDFDVTYVPTTTKVCDVLLIGACGDGGGGAGGNTGGIANDSTTMWTLWADDDFICKPGGVGGTGGGPGGNGGFGEWKFLQGISCSADSPIRTYSTKGTTVGGAGGIGYSHTAKTAVQSGSSAFDTRSSATMFIASGLVYSASDGAPGTGGEVNKGFGGCTSREEGFSSFNQSIAIVNRVVDIRTGIETVETKSVALPPSTTRVLWTEDSLKWTGDVIVYGNAPPGTVFFDDEYEYMWIYRGVRASASPARNSIRYGLPGVMENTQHPSR
jgi:hypothetical protein